MSTDERKPEKNGKLFVYLPPLCSIDCKHFCHLFFQHFFSSAFLLLFQYISSVAVVVRDWFFLFFLFIRCGTFELSFWIALLMRMTHRKVPTFRFWVQWKRVINQLIFGHFDWMDRTDQSTTSNAIVSSKLKLCRTGIFRSWFLVERDEKEGQKKKKKREIIKRRDKHTKNRHEFGPAAVCRNIYQSPIDVLLHGRIFSSDRTWVSIKKIVERAKKEVKGKKGTFLCIFPLLFTLLLSLSFFVKEGMFT